MGDGAVETVVVVERDIDVSRESLVYRFITIHNAAFHRDSRQRAYGDIDVTGVSAVDSCNRDRVRGQMQLHCRVAKEYEIELVIVLIGQERALCKAIRLTYGALLAVFVECEEVSCHCAVKVIVL